MPLTSGTDIVVSLIMSELWASGLVLKWILPSQLSHCSKDPQKAQTASLGVRIRTVWQWSNEKRA